MGLFDKKTPMEKWRKRNPQAAGFVDARGWDVDLDTGAVHTEMSGQAVTALLSAGEAGTLVIVEAGAQAERTLRNEFGDDGGEPFEAGAWRGSAAPGSGLAEITFRGGLDDAFFDEIVNVAQTLVARIT